MLKYVYEDMLSMVRHLPWSFALGLPFAAILLWGINFLRRRRGKAPAAALPVIAFGVYLSVLLIITFLSRESGNKAGADFKLFSTWGINKRNNAFVIENVLLFLPFGFLGGWAFEAMRNVLCCTMLGAAVSVGIECLQLVTGRGFFQIDDILTNTLGAFLGSLVFWLLRRMRK